MNTMERLFNAIKDFFVTILNVLLMIVTFGTKKIQKNFSIQTYEMKIMKMKDDILKAQNINIDVAKTLKKLKNQKVDLEKQTDEIIRKIKKAKDRNDLKTANKLKLQYDSLKKQIENLATAIASSENNLILIDKSIEMLDNQVSRERIKINELKNKEQTSQTISNVNNLVKEIKIGAIGGLDMKNIADSIENDFIDSKVENEVLLEKFSNVDNENDDYMEFGSIDEIDEFLNSNNDAEIKTENQE